MIEWRSFDYRGLEAAMAFADETIREAKLLFATRTQAVRGKRAECSDSAMGALPEPARATGESSRAV
jgi:hypothetical protein